MITVKADPSRRVTYGELIGGRRFNVTLTGNEHQCHDRRGKDKGGPGPQDRRQADAPLRHSAKGGRLVEVGRGREGSRHGPRAQRAPAGGWRQDDQHRRVFRPRDSRVHQGGEQGQLRRRRVRAGRAGDQGGQAAQGQLAEAGDRAVPELGGHLQVHPHRHADVERRTERGRQPGRGAGRRRDESSKPNTSSRSRDTRPSVRPTPWPTRRTAR